MPLYSFRCQGCGTEFETLVGASDLPACPGCSSTDLQRLIGSVAPQGKSGETLGKLRSQAAREGHFSNYSRSELKGRR